MMNVSQLPASIRFMADIDDLLVDADYRFDDAALAGFEFELASIARHCEQLRSQSVALRHLVWRTWAPDSGLADLANRAIRDCSPERSMSFELQRPPPPPPPPSSSSPSSPPSASSSPPTLTSPGISVLISATDADWSQDGIADALDLRSDDGDDVCDSDFNPSSSSHKRTIIEANNGKERGHAAIRPRKKRRRIQADAALPRTSSACAVHKKMHKRCLHDSACVRDAHELRRRGIPLLREPPNKHLC
jgi:hypothetical protein